MYGYKKKRIIAAIVAVVLILTNTGLLFEKGFASTDSYKLMARNKNLELYVNEKYGYIKLINRKNNTVWLSTPERWKQDNIAAGITRMQMASQLTIKYTDVTSTIQIANAYVNSVLKKGLKIEKIRNGFLATYTFKKEGFVIPIAFTITDEYLSVDLLVGKIKELKKEKYRLVSVMLLPFFGAASTNDSGYIVVPDGCGALINFNNNKGAETYSQRVYGSDFAIVPDFQGYVTQAARMPVFGMKKNDGGFLCVITKGDGKATINANTSGVKSSYNNVFAEFILREYDMVTLKEKQWDERTFNIFEESLPKTDRYSIRYYMLNSPENTYVSMAKKYREYLIKEEGFKKTSDDLAPFYVELYGSMKKQRYIMGLPINSTIAFTTFDDAISIVESLKKLGIDNIYIKYDGWLKNGVMYSLPLKSDVEGVLGGRKALERMLDYFDRSGVKTYLDVDFVTFRHGTLKYMKNKVSTKSMKKVPAEIRKYQPSIMYYDDSYPVLNMVSPRYMLEIIGSFVKNVNVRKFNNISVSTLSSMLYSDFGTRAVNRYDSELVFLKGVLMLKDRFKNIMISSPNMYLVKYANDIVDLPIYSSKFLIEDAEIPFYQMVLRGFIPYSTPSVNMYTNDWMWRLKSLETGSYLKFSWTCRNEDELKETLLESLYSSNYKKWLGSVKSYYNEIYPILKRIKNQQIKDHQILKKGVNKTVFQDGTQIIVNYTNKDEMVDGQKIASHGYKVIYKR